MPPRRRSNEANRAAGAHPYRMRDTLELPAGTPRCPIRLDKWGRRAWKRLIPVLQDARVLTMADGLPAGLLARAIGDLDEAKAMLASSGGPVIDSRLGERKMNPWAMEHQRAFGNVCKLMVEFGLTPAARLKVQVSPRKDAKGKDPLEDMLG